MKIGTKIQCIDAGPMSHWIKNGSTYTFAGMKESGLYMLSETGTVGYFHWRFRKLDDEFDSFMDRVMKPVNLDAPIAA